MKDKIRVGIIGVGNCASSLVQGIEFYRGANADDFVPGLMHVDLGGYHVRDIEFTAAFDIAATKVGRDLGEAIFAEPNNTIKFADVPKLGVKVHRGMTHDGLGKYLKKVIKKSPASTDDIVGILKRTKTDVVISYLPVGSEMATKWYVEQILEAGCAFINCVPVFIASQPYWQRRFEERKLPIIGDDIKSQVGATISHRVLTNLFRDRGVRLDRTYQLNFGGNTDFLNMLERERLESKKISKTQAVTSQLGHALAGQGCARRAERLRAVVDRSQVVLHPHGRDDIRQRAVELRDETRGLGFAEFSRRRDRRDPLREARARSRFVGFAGRALELLHEVAAGAIHR